MIWCISMRRDMIFLGFKERKIYLCRITYIRWWQEVFSFNLLLYLYFIRSPIIIIISVRDTCYVRTMNLIHCTLLSMMSCISYTFWSMRDKNSYTNNRMTHICVLTLLKRRKIYLALRRFSLSSLIFYSYHNHHCHGFTQDYMHGCRLHAEYRKYFVNWIFLVQQSHTHTRHMKNESW